MLPDANVRGRGVAPLGAMTALLNPSWSSGNGLEDDGEMNETSYEALQVIAYL